MLFHSIVHIPFIVIVECAGGMKGYSAPWPRASAVLGCSSGGAKWEQK